MANGGFSNETPSEPDQGLALGRNFLSSVVVFLVALPLCMGIAIASGAPVAAGLITGIIGGLIVGWLGGSQMSVSGPAAGLTVIVYEIIQAYGYEALGIVVLLAGFIQLVAGICKVGLWFRAVPPVVVEGMLAGIGVLIIGSQFHVLVDDAPKGSGWRNLYAIPAAFLKAIPLPESESPEMRKSHLDLLTKIVPLHTQQRVIQSKAESILPKASAHEADAPVPEITAIGKETLVALSKQQDELVGQLEVWRTTVRGDAGKVLGTETQERLLSGADAAIDSGRAAAKMLAEGEPSKISSTQKASTAKLAEVAGMLKSPRWAGKLGLATILIMLGWQSIPIKTLKVVPAPLVAIAIVTIVASAFQLPVVHVNVPANLANELHFPTWQSMSQMNWQGVIMSGGVVALIASAETLLCCTAVDQMHQGQRTRYDRELMAQGAANMLCGVVNALPMTGVIVRSAANVQAGATSRLSAILHGVWLLVFVLFFSSILRAIPTAALAAMLVYTGTRLIKISMFQEYWHLSKTKVAILLITIIVIVAEDLLTGVVVGIVLSALRLLVAFAYCEFKLTPRSDGKSMDLHIAGAATFMRLPQLASVLDKVPDGTELHAHLEKLTFIDHACLELLINWDKRHKSTGGTLHIDWESLTAKFNARAGSESSRPAHVA